MLNASCFCVHILFRSFVMDRTARNALVVENLPLVGYLVSEVWGRATHLSRDDLASAGALALITAAEAFDPTLGVPFGAYALRWLLSRCPAPSLLRPTPRTPSPPRRSRAHRLFSR
jgi:hypothetical protein